MEYLAERQSEMTYSSADDIDQQAVQLSINLTAAADDDHWETVINLQSAGELLTLCSRSDDWKPRQHAVFQAAHGVLLLAFLIPNTRRTLLLIHSTLVTGKY